MPSISSRFMSSWKSGSVISWRGDSRPSVAKEPRGTCIEAAKDGWELMELLDVEVDIREPVEPPPELDPRDEPLGVKSVGRGSRR